MSSSGSKTPSTAGGHSAQPTPISFEINPDTTGFSLSDFLAQLEDYTPTLPDTISNHFLHQSGFESSDPRMSRVISVASQKFISDIVNEAYTHCKLKASAPPGKGAKGKVEKKLVLTLEDLIPVLAEYGVTVKKPPYYV